jgi:hypothetical protein
MAKYVLVVITNPTPGQEDEFNRWYTDQHLDDVLRIPGYVAAQRFKLTIEAAKSLPGPYLALYEMETEDPEATFAELKVAVDSGKMSVSSSLDMVNLVTSVFTPITERKVSNACG